VEWSSSEERLTENAGRENDGPSSKTWKCETNLWKISPTHLSCVVALPEKNNDRRITLSMINLTRYRVSTKGTVRGNALMDLSPRQPQKKGQIGLIFHSNIFHAASGWASTVVTDCLQCDQPSGRKKLKTRQDGIKKITSQQFQYRSDTVCPLARAASLRS